MTSTDKSWGCPYRGESPILFNTEFQQGTTETLTWQGYFIIINLFVEDYDFFNILKSFIF